MRIDAGNGNNFPGNEDYKIGLIKDLCLGARKKAFIEAHTSVFSRRGDLYMTYRNYSSPVQSIPIDFQGDCIEVSHQD